MIAVGFSTTTPSAVTPSRRSWKAVTSSSTTSVSRRVSTLGAVEQCRGLLADEPGLELAVADGADRLEVEAALERARHLVDAAVAQVGGGEHVEAACREDDGVVAGQLGHVQDLVGEQADQDVLDLRLDAGDLLEPADPALGQRVVHGPAHECPRRRALGEQERVVPRVGDLVLRGARRALDGERRVAGDRCGEELRQHRLRGAGLADEQQAAVAHQGDDAAVDEGVVAVELLGDPEPRVAEHEGPHGARGSAASPRAAARCRPRRAGRARRRTSSRRAP
jgi:hypothetical protein